MSLDLNKFTEKSQKVVAKGKTLAQQKSHSEVTPIHLMMALLEDEDALASNILKKTSGDFTNFQRQVTERFNKLPSIKYVLSFCVSCTPN